MKRLLRRTHLRLTMLDICAEIRCDDDDDDVNAELLRGDWVLNLILVTWDEDRCAESSSDEAAGWLFRARSKERLDDTRTS